MDRRRLKFLVLILGVAGSMVFLLVVGAKKPGGLVYYQTVGEFLADPTPHSGNRRVNGKVESGSIERMSTGEDVRFTMTDGQVGFTVAYHGIIPDTFVDEADVVVEGTLRKDGVFEATTLLAKCPSKYEAADDASSGAAPGLRTASP